MNLSQLPFPFNIHQAMALWNVMFLDNSRYQPDDSKDDLWNRGAYLARGLDVHRAGGHYRMEAASAPSRLKQYRIDISF